MICQLLFSGKSLNIFTNTICWCLTCKKSLKRGTNYTYGLTIINQQTTVISFIKDHVMTKVYHKLNLAPVPRKHTRQPPHPPPPPPHTHTHKHTEQIARKKRCPLIAAVMVESQSCQYDGNSKQTFLKAKNVWTQRNRITIDR